MKKILCLLFCALLLCACVPTPTEEFVVYRGDDAIEQKLSVTEAPIAKNASDTDEAVQRFPSRWTEDAYTINDRVTVEIDAEIVQKADGLYPVYRTRGSRIMPEDAVRILEKLLPPPVSEHSAEKTKGDWTREFKAYLEEVEAHRAWIAAGMPDDGKDHDETEIPQSMIDDMTDTYMQEIQNAPEKLIESPVSDFRSLKTGDRKVFELSDGRSVCVALLANELRADIGCCTGGFVYPEDLYLDLLSEKDETYIGLWREPTLQREQAEAVLRETEEKLGLTGFTVRSAQKACLLDNHGTPAYVTAGWSFILVRDYGGYPQSVVPFAPAQILEYGAGDGFSANKPIQKEEVEIVIDESGVVSFRHSSPHEIVGVESTNVELLPWEEAKLRIRNAIAVTAPNAWLDKHDFVYRQKIWRLLLTNYTVRVRNQNDYYEMPCWVVFFDMDFREADKADFYDTIYTDEHWEKEHNDTNLLHDVLIVNAVDGSIVYTDLNDYGR